MQRVLPPLPKYQIVISNTGLTLSMRGSSTIKLLNFVATKFPIVLCRFFFFEKFKYFNRRVHQKRVKFSLSM